MLGFSVELGLPREIGCNNEQCGNTQLLTSPPLFRLGRA